MADLFDSNGAVFSKDRKYRYSLFRLWNLNEPTIMFIGLNPSTANEISNDPTIRRVTKFAFDWGYGGVYMMNLFAYVTPYPIELKKCGDPIGENDKYLQGAKCDQVVFAWGNFKEATERSIEVIKMFPGALCLDKNMNGTPKHPLYVPASTKLIKF